MLAVSSSWRVIMKTAIPPSFQSDLTKRAQSSFKRWCQPSLKMILQSQGQSNLQTWRPCCPLFGGFTTLLQGHFAMLLVTFRASTTGRTTNTIQRLDVTENHCQCGGFPFHMTHRTLVEVEHLDVVGLSKSLPFLRPPDRHELLFVYFFLRTIPIAGSSGCSTAKRSEVRAHGEHLHTTCTGRAS